MHTFVFMSAISYQCVLKAYHQEIAFDLETLLLPVLFPCLLEGVMAPVFFSYFLFSLRTLHCIMMIT
jgi:flagellar biosynthesis protein FlhB